MVDVLLVLQNVCELWSLVQHMVDVLLVLQNVCELWSVVQHMVDVPVVMADSPVARRTAVPSQTAFVRQALLYLERRSFPLLCPLSSLSFHLFLFWF